MKAVNAGIISDMKSLIDSLTGGLAKLFEVVTDTDEDGNTIFSFTKTLSDKRKVSCKLKPDEKEGLFMLEINVTGGKKTVLRGITARDVDNKLYDTLEKTYGITREMIGAVKSSRKCIAGLKKIECADSVDIVLTSIYASDDIPTADIQLMLDSALESDELIEQISEEPMLIEISDIDDDISIETEPDMSDIENIERQNALDHQNAAVVIDMLANVIFMESRTRFSDSIEAMQLADQIRSLADNLFETVASATGDLDVGVGILNDRVMSLLRDSDAGEGRFDIYEVLRDRIDFLDFFSVNIQSNESYSIHSICTDLFGCLEKYTESVFGYADGQ